MSNPSETIIRGDQTEALRIHEQFDAFDHLITLCLEGTLPKSELPELRQQLDEMCLSQSA